MYVPIWLMHQIMNSSYENPYIYEYALSKGQLISEGLFAVIVSTKNSTKFV